MAFDLRTLLRNRIALAGSAVVLAVLVIAALAMASGGDDDPETVVAPTETPSASPSPQPSLEPVSTAIPVVPGTDSNDRIVIPEANVDAPITRKEVPSSGGALPSPNGPDDVAYYDFNLFPGLGGYPGSGGRIVMSGHVDYGGGPCKNGTVPPPCTAIFWDLSDLKPGDVIELHLPNGVHRYRVTGSQNIGPNDQSKWDEVWKATEQETIALVTCGGDFNRQTHEYNSRHVVYGELTES